VDLVGNIVGGTVKGVAFFVAYFLLVLVILICAMFEVAGFPTKLERIKGDPSLLENFRTVMADTQKYLGVKTLISFTTAVLVGFGVWLFDMPIPLFWAVSAFLLNYIPAIGSIIAAIPAVLVALVQQGVGTALLVGSGYLVINFVLGNLIEPALMGWRFRLSTLVVFLALMFWGWIWGPIGMILSIPLTMILKIGLRRSDELRWIALMMEPANARTPPAEVAGKA
jgi:predicted PurR-regulated permease PerM